MIQPRKDPWQRLASGLYVPPLLNFSPGYPCSPCCEGIKCPCACTDAWVDIEVTFAGVADGLCSDCDPSFNDTFILTRTLNDCLATGRCYWRYVESGTCDDPCFYANVHYYDVDGHYYFNVRVDDHGSCGTLLNPDGYWFADLGLSKPDCTNWTDLNIPYVSSSGSECDWSSATCSVSSVV